MNGGSAVSDCARTTLTVLAGGEGKRMGAAKAALALHGRPILKRLLDRLDWPGPTLLVTAPGREHPPGWRRFNNEAADAVAGEGPLRGILTALENATTDEVVVVPVDMPNVTPAPLAWLAARLRDHPAAAGVMVRLPGRPGRIEPLPAALRAPIAGMLVRAHLDKRQFALHRLVERSEFVVLPSPFDWPDDFWVNLNTPSELAAYTARAVFGPTD